MGLQLAAIFNDNMVLQREVPVPLWGSAPAGAEVTAELDGPPVRTMAGAGGLWRLDLPAGPAGGPYVLTVRCGGEICRLKQVYRGEVWLAGGQSNIELPLSRSENGEEAVQNSENPRLHVCTVPRATQEPPEDLFWTTVAPANAGELSAVAYYAGWTLAEHLPDIHVGVIVCCWGATYAHCWISREALLAFPEGAKRVTDYDARIGSKPDAVFDREQADYQKALDAWNARPDGPYPWPPPAGRTSFHCPGNLYRAMVRPLAPYALRGFWYYQGEQDEEWPEDYYPLLTGLIRLWRRDWGDEEKPFLLLQLPMFISKADALSGDPMRWPVLRKAQADAARDLPGVELAVLTDCGEFDNVHPLDKYTPGRRLGLLALEAVYRQPVCGRPPVCVAARREGSDVLLAFAHTGGGLTLDGGGFQLAGGDGVFYDANAEIAAPDTVRVSAPGVPAPDAVRYAWYSYGPAGLHGGTGLAAAPLEIHL